MTRYFDAARASSSGTAARWRSSSATRSWPSSGSRRRTRTTRSGRCARRSTSRRRSPALNDELDADARRPARRSASVSTRATCSPATLARGETFATGAAVVVAPSGSSSAAPPGEILVGDATFALVRDAVDDRAGRPGRAEGHVGARRRVARRAVETHGPGRARRSTSPLVGRDAELAELLARLRARRRREPLPRRHASSARPGWASRGSRRSSRAALADRATVARGPLPAVRRGRHLLAARGDPARARRPAARGCRPARARAHRGARCPTRTGRRSSPSGSPRQPARATTRRPRSDEIVWAFRRLLEALARRAAARSSSSTTSTGPSRRCSTSSNTSPAGRHASPILLLCLGAAGPARAPAVVGRAAPGRRRIALRPLAPPDDRAARRACSAPRGRDARGRDRARAGGNPLFVDGARAHARRRAAAHRDARRDLLRPASPPRSRRCSRARLDLLAEDERAGAPARAAIGEVFWWGAVTALLPTARGRAAPGSSCQALVRSELSSPIASALSGEDGFRFGHVLVRDAAYDVDSEARPGASCTSAFADWVDERAARRSRRARRARRLPPRAGVRASPRSSSDETAPRSTRSRRAGAEHLARPGGARSDSATCPQPRTCSSARSALQPRRRTRAR